MICFRCTHPVDCATHIGLYEVRLDDGRTLISEAHEGRLEVRVGENQWGGVCDDSFDPMAGEIACRQLGFPGLYKVIHGPLTRIKYPFRTPTPPENLWLTNVQCNKTSVEALAAKRGINATARMSDCNACPWGYANSQCSKHEFVGVVCNGKFQQAFLDTPRMSCCLLSCLLL